MKPASKHSIGKMSQEVTHEWNAKLRNTRACSRGLLRPPFTISPGYFSRLKSNRSLPSSRFLDVTHTLPRVRDIQKTAARETREIEDSGYAKLWAGGGGVNKVHYGLCENGEFDIRIARLQATSSQNRNRQP